MHFASPEDTPAIVTRDVIDDARRATLSEGELGTVTRFFHAGNATELQMFEVTYEPRAVVEPHAHDESEIIYVLEGEMHFGARVLTPESSVYIPRRTLYSFRAGPDGLRFIEFRARQDLSYIAKQDLTRSVQTHGLPVVRPADRNDAESDCSEDRAGKQNDPDSRVRDPRSRGTP
jgi:quercetin dioxygenase-like cupin family protein